MNLWGDLLLRRHSHVDQAIEKIETGGWPTLEEQGACFDELLRTEDVDGALDLIESMHEVVALKAERWLEDQGLSPDDTVSVPASVLPPLDKRLVTLCVKVAREVGNA